MWQRWVDLFSVWAVKMVWLALFCTCGRAVSVNGWGLFCSSLALEKALDWWWACCVFEIITFFQLSIVTGVITSFAMTEFLLWKLAKLPNVLCILQNEQITEFIWVGKAISSHQSNHSSNSAKRGAKPCLSALNVPKDSDSTTSLGSSLQWLRTLSGKKFILICNLNLPWHNWRPFPPPFLLAKQPKVPHSF